MTFSICFARFGGAGPDRLDVLLEERRVERLAGHDLADAAVHLERPDRGDDDGRIAARGPDARHLMSKNFSAPMSAPKPASVQTMSLVTSASRSAMIELLPWAMLANGPAVDEGRAALERLEQVRLDRVAQQDGHRAGDAEVLGGHRRPVRRASRGRSGRAAPRRSWRSVARARTAMTSEPTVMTNSVSRGIAVLATAEADDDVAQRAVADVEDARPEDAVRVDAERVLVVEAVVDEGAGEVVGRADGVDVAGQVEVEVLHRDDLAVAAAGGAALDAEDRPERRLADVDRRLAADPVEALGEPDGRRRLALAERRRRDRRDDDVLAARPLGLEARDRLERDLGLGRAVELELVVPDARARARSRRSAAGVTERAISRSDGKLIDLLRR